MATYASARLSTKYRLVIPKKVRQALNLQPNDSVLFLIKGNNVYMRPHPQSFTRTLSGLHRHVWSNSDQWLDEERSTWE
jgi:AbrB family looped-hinge helix DNA binding protein